MDISKMLRDARKRKGYTLKELEAVTGIGKSAIQRYECGQDMTITRAIKLFNALDVSMEVVIKRKEGNF